jgi:uncharacterized glyoxalase superfamily protein PhnB
MAIGAMAALAAGGKVEMDLQEMVWGGYFGSLQDRFNRASKA